jgi:hypothetical protein
MASAKVGIPASVRDEARRQARPPPPGRRTREDLEEIANSRPEQDRETFCACYRDDVVERGTAGRLGASDGRRTCRTSRA